MQGIFSELRRIARRLGQAPLFAATALITLAAGIGSNAAIFSVVHTVLLKPLPFSEPERLVGLWHRAPGLNIPRLQASPSVYFTYRDENRVFENLGLYVDGAVTVTGLAEPERLNTLELNASTLDTLRVRPWLGRGFTDKDDTSDSPETAILTYKYWLRRFGGERSVVGKRIIADGKAVEVIGVMGPDFRFLDQNPDLLLPLRFNRADVAFGNFSFNGVARLRPGVTLAAANADVDRMLPMTIEKFKLPPGFTAEMFRATRMEANLHAFAQDLTGDIGNVLWVLMGTVGIIFAIACANVANLFLIRAEGRQQELAVRAALGAGRLQLARELLSESLLLGLGGGALGLALAYGGIRLLVWLSPPRIPRLNEISIDPVVLLFTLAISVLAGILFGLIPVFKHGGSAVGASLKQGGRNSSDSRERHRTRSALAVAQIALALILLIGAGLMLRTFKALSEVQPGFTEPDQVLTFRVSIPEAVIGGPEPVARAFEAIQHRLEGIPGVNSVAFTSAVPMGGFENNDPLFIEDHPLPAGQIPPIRRFKSIAPGYFRVLGNPIIAGRDFTWEDLYGRRPVVILSANLARKFWKLPAEAIGKRVRESPDSPWREVVGVSGDERDDGVSAPAPEIAYWPLLRSHFWGQENFASRSVSFAVRSPRAGSASFGEEVRRAVWAVNPALPLAEVRRLREILDRSLERASFTLVMLGIAGAMALLLGVVGIYGVIAYSVSQRTREIGIRMALGAQTEDVTGMFVTQGAVLTAAGVACGVAAAIGTTRLLTSLLYGVSAIDPVTYAAVSAGLIVVTLLATYIPARRATAVDPVRCLRAD